MTADRVHRAFRLGYDGTAYHGFQRQPGVPTVEDAILAAFDRLAVDALEAGYAAAGRTDAGVSAAAQTIALAVPAWLDADALNGHLPDDVRAWATAEVDPDFHPRHDALDRTYTYHLPVADVDLDRARAVAGRLEGVHDFRDLSAASERTTRELSRLELERHGDVIRITAVAPSFIHQQVRRIVALLETIGTGERTPDAVDPLLDPDHRVHGPDGVAPAPPGPLVLTDVRYESVRFDAVGDETQPIPTVFRDRSRALRGRAAALGAIAEYIGRPADQHG